MKKIRVATTFSGVGAIEHAFQRLGIEHQIVFACDNGGIELFTKKIIDRYQVIKSEIDFLQNHIKKLDLNSDDNYKIKLQDDLDKIVETYQSLSENRQLENFEKIKQTISQTLEFVKRNHLSSKFESFENKILDISDYLYLLPELKKTIKDHKDLFQVFSEIMKDRSVRDLKRDIKEIAKKLSQLHESILTLEILDKLNFIESNIDRKKYVDELYIKQNFVKKSYLANYALDEANFHSNICFLDGKNYRNKVDLYVGGSPCQSFSIVGKRGGFEDTRGTLFYEYARVLKEVNPRFFIYENVKGVLSHDGGKTWEIMQNTFDETGYKYKSYVLNAKDFGIPQHRERLFVIGFKNEDDFKMFKDPEKRPLECSMKDFLEDNVDEKYYLPIKGINFVTDQKNLTKKYTQVNGDIALCQKANQQFNWHGDFIEHVSNEEIQRMSKIDQKYFLSDNVKHYVLDDIFFMNNKPSEQLIDLDVARPLTATMHKMHRAGVDNYVSYGKSLEPKDRKIRKLTPRECFRLMGFCDSFELVVSDTQLYQQAGNSIVVDVLMEIISKIVAIDKD